MRPSNSTTPKKLKHVHTKTQQHYSQWPKAGNSPRGLSIKWYEKHDVVHPHNGYHVVIKRNDVLIHATTWMKLKNIMLNEARHKRRHVV